ncbi:Uncharacterised protein [Mycobacterium tuberculosis]|nr:Uncharacterised protein [Mycobacterium tuberculosis]
MLQSVSTANWPYHLETSLISIIAFIQIAAAALRRCSQVIHQAPAVHSTR